MGLLVADGKDFFSEERRHAKSEVSRLAPGVPAFRLVNTCKQGRYRIEKTVLSDPRRAALLQQIHFTPLQGRLSDYSVYVLLAPHLGNQGADNTAWIGDYKGMPMLFAQRERLQPGPGLLSTVAWRSAGFVGVSDGWQDVSRHKKMEWRYERAENGNVALTGEVDLAATDGRFVLALGFGRDEWDAGHQARASPLQGFAAAREEYVRPWSEWLKEVLPLDQSERSGRSPVPRQRRRDAHARIQGIPGRHHRQPGDPVGLRPRRRRSRLPSGLAARHDRDGRRPPGRPAARGRPARAVLLPASRRTPTGTGRRTCG